MNTQFLTRTRTAFTAVAALAFSSGMPAHSACTYDRQSAVVYSNTWVGDHNSGYMFFPGTDPQGNDCANFVSQCLIAGGLKVAQRAIADGHSAWLAGYNGAETIPNVDNLASFLFGYSTSGGYQFTWGGPSQLAPNNIRAGDVVVFGKTVGQYVDWGHSGIIVEVVRDMSGNTYPYDMKMNSHSTSGGQYNFKTPVTTFWGSPDWPHVKFFKIDRTGEEESSDCRGPGTGPCPTPPCCGSSLRKITAPTEIE
jgi:hypothetical protein